MVLDIVPGNFFTPFTEGNPLQIIFVAVLIGMAMLILGNKATAAASFVEQSNYIVQLIMEAVSSFVPLFVFGSILNMILNNDFSVFLPAYKLIPAMLMGDAILLAVYLVLVCAGRKVHPRVLLKKMMPTFLIALTTASSSAAFGVNMECCEKDLGIDRRIVNLGVPLGHIHCAGSGGASHSRRRTDLLYHFVCPAQNTYGGHSGHDRPQCDTGICHHCGESVLSAGRTGGTGRWPQDAGHGQASGERLK